MSTSDSATPCALAGRRVVQRKVPENANLWAERLVLVTQERKQNANQNATRRL